MDESWYKEHEAFERAYERAKDTPQEYKGYNEAPKFHHAPDKLGVFQHFSGYLAWFNELYVDGQGLVTKLENVWNELNSLPVKWYMRTKRISDLLHRFYRHDGEMRAFRSDVAEFQRCMMATSINHKEGYTSSVQDLVHRLDALETRITVTANTRISSISSTRLTLVGLFLSGLAVLIAA